MSSKKLGAIILAAGKGKRLKMKTANKVTLVLSGKPMITYIVQLLKDIRINPIIIVVGFAKKSVMQLFDNHIMFIEQKKRLGTAHATMCALKKLPENISDVIVLQGDDSAFYRKELITKLINAHFLSSASLTFLTIELPNPLGLGRVVRDFRGRVIAVVEEKDATGEQRGIREVNPACYIFKVDFLRKYLSKIKKSKVTGEYYLPRLIDIAISNKEKIETVRAGILPWRGVNTREELTEAERLFSLSKS